MNRGTWLRTVAIQNCVTSFYKQCGGVPIQVISFGAGVDTLYFRLRKENPNLKLAKFVELDFADLVREKELIIKKNSIFSSCIGDDDNYALLPCDLRKPEAITALLKKHVTPGIPTILLAEMVFVYIEASITTELLRQTLENVLEGDRTPVEFISYDAMQPSDRFGQMMVDNLDAIGASLKGIHDLPTTEAHEARAKEVGFSHVKAFSMKKLYLLVPTEQQRWMNKLEMIDDWDEWNLVHEHYCFVIATTANVELPQIFESS
ncbi:tRNA wybutosine-synthesizing protein 4 [Strigomonas culicis]|nr:tRNA wybutosine-synthesizing protein 4 [Strigomonas culicis]|eukprot:EPY24228.1 tRNA wybutosine-synthesizing protein 4 [Strigomonas culicis]